MGSTPISAGHRDCPRGASGEICSQRRTQRVERTGLSMAAAAHRVAVAAGALACPFRPSWRCQAGAAADHPEPGRSKLLGFFFSSPTQALTVQGREKRGIRPVGQSRFEDEDGADTRGFGGWVATGKAPCGVPPLRPPDFDSDPVSTWRKRGLRRWCL